MKTKDITRRHLLRVGGLAGAGLLTSTAAPSFLLGNKAFAAATDTVSGGSSAADRTLRVSVDDFGSEIFDPNITDGKMITLLNPMFDTAFISDDTGLVPGLIEKWEMADDKLSWIFHVRKGVTFHDGSALTGKDVKYSYERSINPEGEEGGAWRGVIGDKPHVELIDDYTVQVFTPKPQPFLPLMSSWDDPFMYIVPMDYIEKNGEDYFKANPIGSGPYKLSKRAAGNYIEYEAVDYPHWSGFVPDFKRVVFYLVPEETTRIQMLQNNEIDEAPLSLDTALQVSGQNGVTTQPNTYAAVWLGFIGSYLPEAKSSPLSNIKFRQALSLAINRQEIIDGYFHGQAKLPPPTRSSLDHAYLPQDIRKKWWDWAANAYRYDPDAAKKLLAEAGYNGAAFEIWSLPDTSAPYDPDLVQLCVGYWAKLGINATTVPVDNGVWRQVRHTSKSLQAVGKAVIQASDYGDPALPVGMNWWTSSNGPGNLLVGAPQQADFDKLYTAAISESDIPKLVQDVDAMYKMSTDSWTAIPLLIGTSLNAYSARVKPVFPPDVQVGKSEPYYFNRWKYTGVEPS